MGGDGCLQLAVMAVEMQRVLERAARVEQEVGACWRDHVWVCVGTGE